MALHFDVLPNTATASPDFIQSGDSTTICVRTVARAAPINAVARCTITDPGCTLTTLNSDVVLVSPGGTPVCSRVQITCANPGQVTVTIFVSECDNAGLPTGGEQQAGVIVHVR